MTKEDAFRTIVEMARRSILNEEERLILCDALEVIAVSLGMPSETGVVRSLAAAIRAQDQAQVSFDAMTGRPPAPPESQDGNGS